MGVGELALRAWKQENWPHPLFIAAEDELARAMLESSPWWWGRQTAGRLTNPAAAQAQNQVYELAHPNISTVSILSLHPVKRKSMPRSRNTGASCAPPEDLSHCARPRRMYQEKVRHHTGEIQDLRGSMNLLIAKLQEMQAMSDKQKMAQKIMKMIHGDYIEKPDFALKSIGASIDFEHTSATYNHDKARSYWNWIRLWNYAQPPDPNVTPGNCWAFAGDRGQVTIRLAQKVYLSNITLQHIPKTISLSGSLDTAPKDFVIYTPGCDTTHIDEEPLPHPRSCANLSLLHFIPPLSGSTGNGEPPQGRSVPGGIPVSARKHDPDVPTPGTWGGHKGASAECVPHVQLSPVPYSPERGIVTLAYLTDEETEVTWSCYLGPRVAPRESLLTPASRPRFQVPPGVLLLHLLDSKC
ncbi:Sad1 and UNC84 domain containing 5 [Cricetulus griseus]